MCVCVDACTHVGLCERSKSEKRAKTAPLLERQRIIGGMEPLFLSLRYACASE